MFLVRSTSALITATVFVGLGSTGSATTASAQANCEMYGRMALQQMQQNVQDKCNLTGPEWSSDLKAHTTWCSSVGPDQWKVQLQKREQALAACAVPKKS
jgi:sarcosine oxidase gamma subunit